MIIQLLVHYYLNMWDKIFKQMAEGKIPYNRKFYSFPQTGRGENDTGITLVSPTQQQTQIARSEVRMNAKRKANTRTPANKNSVKSSKKRKIEPKSKPKKTKAMTYITAYKKGKNK